MNKVKMNRREKEKQKQTILYCHEDIMSLKKGMCLVDLVDNSQFKDFYRLLVEVVDKMVYVDKDKFGEYEVVIRSIFSEETCAEIFDKSRLKGLTNQEMLHKIINKTSRYFENNEDQKKKQQQMILEQEKQIDVIQKENKQLEVKILQLGGMIDQEDQIFKIRQLQAQNDLLQKKLDEAYQEIRLKDHNLKDLKQDLQIQTQQNKDLNNENLKLKIEETNYNKNLQSYKDVMDKKIKEFEIFKQKIQSLRYFIESLLIKTNTITEHFRVLESEKEEIQNERIELIKRAAMSFDQLTPRPNVHQLCESKNISFEKMFGQFEENKKQVKSKKLKVDISRGTKRSTSEYFEYLLGLAVNYKNEEFNSDVQSNQSPTRRRKKEDPMNRQKKKEEKREEIEDKPKVNKDEFENKQKNKNWQDEATSYQKNELLTKHFQEDQQKLESKINSEQFYQKQKVLNKQINQSLEELTEMEKYRIE